MLPTLDPQEAYQADLDARFAPFCDDDGSIVVVASMLDQIARSRDTDPHTILDGANRLTLEILERRFPAAAVPPAQPGALHLGPPLALAESIKRVLPNLANHLAVTTLAIVMRDRELSDDAPVHDGLSTRTIFGLTDGDWVNTGAFRVDGKHISADLLDRSDFLHDARQFLIALRNHGPFGTTRTYNLNRSAMDILRPRLRLSAPLLKDPQLNVVIDQVDEWLVVQRTVLQMRRLIAYRTKHLCLTPRGLALLPDDRRGELLALLFVALFADVDLRALDHHSDQEYRGLRGSLPICFYLIGRHATDWIPAEEITDATWLPVMRDEPEYPNPKFSKLHQLAARYRARVLRPLGAFGMLDERMGQSAPEYRITPLFNALLRFNLAEPAVALPSFGVGGRLVQ